MLFPIFAPQPALVQPFSVPQVPQAVSGELETTVRRYSTDRSSIRSFYRLGLSETALNRSETFLKEWLTLLDKLDFNRLNADGKIDYHLLRDDVEYGLRQIVFQRERNAETLALVPFAPRIVALEEARWRLVPMEPEKTAGELSALADAVKKEREAKKPIKPSLALRTANAVGDLRRALGGWFSHYNGFKPLFSWWCRKPYDTARQELEQYEKYLRETVAGVKGKDDDPLLGDPIGREALLSDLRHERIPYTPEELVKIAEREFAWCEAEMKKAAREMGTGDDWKTALEKVKANHVGPGEQDDLVAKQAKDAIAFVEARDLVTIDPLCRETWRVDMIGLEQQKFLPFAAYGGQRMLVAYPLEEMDHATKEMSLRGNNIHFNRIVTPHELIPGHHLQGYMSERYRPYRQEFSTPFLVEGWALYWEMLLWDLKYPQSPQDRIGMLFWRMHRCARIIVSLNFHLGTMTPAQMVDFLVERVGHERFPATSEVRRFISGGYSPLYQCAYMIGGLQLRELYRELVTEGRPKKMTPRAFHDAVLKENEMPIELIRARLTEQIPAKGAAPAWKFGG
jgi:uncharacterized protein (DUF885 family)